MLGTLSLDLFLTDSCVHWLIGILQSSTAYCKSLRETRVLRALSSAAALPTNRPYLSTYLILEPANLPVLPTMATATASPPVVPPRPSRSTEDKASVPMVPPRPANKRVQRSVTPNPERFAPSPLNEAIFLKSPGSLQPAQNAGSAAHHDISGELPSVGEEGKEYANLAEELPRPTRRAPSKPGLSPTTLNSTPRSRLCLPPAQSSASRPLPEPTASAPLRSALEGRAVPRIPPPDPRTAACAERRATASQVSTAGSQVDEEHGIPEIGLQVPMYKNAGDVQAPSPAPAGAEGAKGKHHVRKTSARGNLPPGSYGLAWPRRGAPGQAGEGLLQQAPGAPEEGAAAAPLRSAE